jgi:hypothetical protein
MCKGGKVKGQCQQSKDGTYVIAKLLAISALSSKKVCKLCANRKRVSNCVV